MKLNNDQFRQGDVALIACDAIPEDATEIKRDADGSLTLALGEATGHRHRFADHGVHLYETPRKERFLRVVKTSNLLHEEHTAHEIPPGLYRLPTQTEWNDENEPRAVQD